MRACVGSFEQRLLVRELVRLQGTTNKNRLIVISGDHKCYIPPDCAWIAGCRKAVGEREQITLAFRPEGWEILLKTGGTKIRPLWKRILCVATLGLYFGPPAMIARFTIYEKAQWPSVFIEDDSFPR